jgi:hypothetical protein
MFDRRRNHATRRQLVGMYLLLGRYPVGSREYWIDSYARLLPLLVGVVLLVTAAWVVNHLLTQYPWTVPAGFAGGYLARHLHWLRDRPTILLKVVLLGGFISSFEYLLMPLLQLLHLPTFTTRFMGPLFVFNGGTALAIINFLVGYLILRRASEKEQTG